MGPGRWRLRNLPRAKKTLKDRSVETSLQILIFLALILLLSKGIGELCARISLPVVMGELAAGVILGPTVINIWKLSWFAAPATGGAASVPSLHDVVRLLAQLGVVILMFLAGLETDVQMMRSAVGPSLLAAVGGVILPFAGGIPLGRLAGYNWREAVFIGAILTATSVSISAQTLRHMKALRSKIGATILGAAVIDDVLGIVILSLVLAVEMLPSTKQSFGWSSIGVTVGRMAAFLVLAFWLGPRLIRWVMHHSRRVSNLHTSIAASLALAFLFAFLAQYGGALATITGSYLAGFFMASNSDHVVVLEGVRAITDSFFAPIFFVSIGLDINAWLIAGHLGFFSVILLLAVLGKAGGCALGGWLKGLRTREALTVGVGMIPRGEVELMTASVGWGLGLISNVIYSIVVVLVLVTTLIAPPLLRIFLRPNAKVSEA